MTFPIFLDTNLVIYAAGRPHPYKDPCRQILTLTADTPTAFLTDAEVLQELLHRYLRLQAWHEGRQVLRNFAALMQGRIEPITSDDIERAADLADHHAMQSGRDLLHVAVMLRAGCDQIVSADRDFDRFSGIQRLDPMNLGTWRSQLEQPT